MLQLIVHAVEQELALDAVAGTAHAGALGAAALDHEAGNDAVEDEAVIKAAVCQRDEVIDRLRRDIRVELGGDDAAVFHFNGHNRIFHGQ